MLDQLACNARLTGVIYDRAGRPIWRTHSGRKVTESQWQLLIAKWGGCFHCGANPSICQGHHIEPVSQGGPTKLANLVPACWTCHQRIHHDGWWILKHPDGDHTLHPPERTRHGPAHGSDQAPVPFNDSLGGDHTLHPPERTRHGPARASDQPNPLLKPSTQHDSEPPELPRGTGRRREGSRHFSGVRHEPLFTLS